MPIQFEEARLEALAESNFKWYQILNEVDMIRFNSVESVG
jgi:hypothetical protein